jgi:dTDP-4-dehydrorhamnose reductase
MKKILISGGEGKLAKQIKNLNSEYQILSPTHKEMDITKLEDLESMIKKHDPDIFLHAAAYTRPMYKHQENNDVSVKTNIIGTANVVLVCIKYNIKLVYISTDYVYPGIQGNYNEEASLSPYKGNNDGVTKYGWSKLGGECAVRMHNDSLILRVCMCNYPFPHKAAAIDIRKSLMFEHDAATVILKLLEENGVINVGGPAQTVYEFASESNPKVERISRKDIKDVNIAPDTTMNIEKMQKALESI